MENCIFKKLFLNHISHFAIRKEPGGRGHIGLSSGPEGWEIPSKMGIRQKHPPGVKGGLFGTFFHSKWQQFKSKIFRNRFLLLFYYYL